MSIAHRRYVGTSSVLALVLAISLSAGLLVPPRTASASADDQHETVGDSVDESSYAVRPTDVWGPLETPEQAAESALPQSPRRYSQASGTVAPAVPDRLPQPLAEGVTRLSGSGRVETAATISAATTAANAPVVYIATATNFPDALAGGPAAALSGGPVLLTSVDSLPEATRAELARLRPERVVILGGPAAVGESVATELEALAAEVDRLAGADRIATAAAISRDTFPGGSDAVYVATAGNFPDALAGGVAAGLDQAPLLLADSGGVPDATREEIQRLEPSRIILLGGTAALSQAVEAELGELATEVDRVAGSNRVATAIRVAERFQSGSVGSVFLATGGDFPDALAAAPAAASYGSPLLLTLGDELPESVQTEIDRLDAPRLVVTGGTAAVSDGVVAQAQASLTRTPPLSEAVLTAARDGDLEAFVDALENDPGSIDQAIRQVVEYRPEYAGVAKRPEQTLSSRSGTALDIAVLTQAALDQAGVEAGFATGRATISSADAMRWLGYRDLLNAGRPLLLTDSAPVWVTADGEEISVLDIPFGTVLSDLPELTSLRFTHTWVEAAIDGQTVVFDPAYRQHMLVGPVDLAAEAGLDDAAAIASLAELPGEVFADDPGALIGDVGQDDIVAIFDERRQDVLDAVDTTLTFSEISAEPVQIPSPPVALPADDATDVVRSPSLPDAAYRYVNVRVLGAEASRRQVDLTGRGLTIDYVGESPDDQATLDDNGGVIGLEPSSVFLMPRILLDGEPIAEATFGNGLGLRERLDVSVTLGPPDLAGSVTLERADHPIVVGGVYVITPPAGRLGPAEIQAAARDLDEALASGQDPTSEGVMGPALFALSRQYWVADDMTSDWLERSSTEAVYLAARGALFGHRPVEGPDGMAAGGFFMDIGDSSSVGVLDRSGPDDGDARAVFLALGFMGSTLEHDVFERGIGFPALSTMEILADAAESGSLMRVTEDTVDSLEATSLPGATQSRLRSAIENDGATVLIPAGESVIGDRNLYGYALLLPSGAGEYLIEGSLNGGAGLLDLIGFSPDQQRTILNSQFGGLVALLDGFLLGDLSDYLYGDPTLERFRTIGQILSGLLVFGDVRDLLASLSRGDEVGAGLALVGFLPLGELARGVRFAPELVEEGLGSSVSRNRLDELIGSDVVDGLLRATLRHITGSDIAEDVLSRPADEDNEDCSDLRITRQRGSLAGAPYQNILVDPTQADLYLQCIGLNPATFDADVQSGRFGDAVANDEARRRGWALRYTPTYPSAPGVDAVYDNAGTFVVTENKGTRRRQSSYGATDLRTTVATNSQYELSERWLLGEAPSGSSAIQRALAARRLDQPTVDLLRPAIESGTYSREVIIGRGTFRVGSPVRASLVTRTTLLAAPVAGVRVVQISKP